MLKDFRIIGRRRILFITRDGYHLMYGFTLAMFTFVIGIFIFGSTTSELAIACLFSGLLFSMLLYFAEIREKR